MTDAIKSTKTAEFGDFQTPMALAVEACLRLKSLGVNAVSIVEPTCGIGNFLIAALGAFPQCAHAVGMDINEDYVAVAKKRISELPDADKTELHCGSFFTTDWENILASLPEPILVVGNPPWVTNSHLGTLGSDNLPTKSNFQNHVGFDAITGKSNFDISEWMIIRLLKQLQGRKAVLALLCKTAVARKALAHVWKKHIFPANSSLYLINATEHFGATVDACLMVCETGSERGSYDCEVFDGLTSAKAVRAFGYRDDQIVADVEAYGRSKHLQGIERYKWRSGIKHDCSALMELRRVQDGFMNGLKERVDLELEYMYPMFKSSDIARGKVADTDRYMLVPQTAVGQDTAFIKENAPKLWAYLQKHGHLLDRRGSSIYKSRPRFSIFGVGPYSFSPWKVAISGFYKSLNFRVIGQIEGKPAVFDDTVNFISCQTREEADCMASLLNSSPAAEFFNAFIFWDAKRPVTIDLLKRIDLLRVAEASGVLGKAARFLNEVTRGASAVAEVLTGYLPF